MRAAFVLALLALIVVGSPAAGGVAPSYGPPIGSLLGTWEVKFSGYRIDFGTTTVTKISEVAHWTVTQTGPATILIADFGSGLGENYDAGYRNGTILVGAHFDGGTVITTRVGFAQVKGAGSKLSLKGQFILLDTMIGNRIEVTRFSGKWVGSAVPAKPLGTAAPDAPPARAKTAPAAGDLLGATFAMKFSLKGFSLDEPMKGGETRYATWTVTAVSGDVVTIHSVEEGGDQNDIKGFYRLGVLFVGVGDSMVVSTEAVAAVGTVTGSPGKLAMKAVALEWHTGVGDDRYAAVNKVSGKQTGRAP
jgi:hypothetical protein